MVPARENHILNAKAGFKIFRPARATFSEISIRFGSHSDIYSDIYIYIYIYAKMVLKRLRGEGEGCLRKY